jgi:large subunit ribosomal protein L29
MATSVEIAEYDTEELETQLSETRRELFNLRFQLATGRLDNFSRLNHVRKDVARMMTELRAREIAEAEGLAAEEIPAHRAAARLRSEDDALGRTRTTAAERRAASKAEREAAEADEADEAKVEDHAAVDESGAGAEATDDEVSEDAASDNAASDEQEEG